MKKLLLLLMLIVGATSFTGCTKDKYYTNYSVGANNWSGGTEAMHGKASRFLIERGYVSQFQLTSGMSLDENNQEAMKFYDSKTFNLKNQDLAAIAKELKGMEGSPCTISFDYLILYSGNDKWNMLATETMSLQVEQ